MDIRQLRYFIAVAENLNFSKAAQSLYISQSTLSQQIAHLEAQIGVKLLLRNSRKVHLTPAGAAFLKEVKFLIARLDEAVRIACQTEYTIAGTLRIGFLGGVQKQIFAKLLARIRRQYPSIKLFLKSLDIRALDKALRHNEVDIGITMSVGLARMPGVGCKKLSNDILCLVIARDHPLVDKVGTDFSVLCDQPFFFDTGSRGLEHLLQICADRGVSPQVFLEHDLETVLLLIGTGAGVSILPFSVSEAYGGPNLTYIKLSGADSVVDTVVIWKVNNDNPCISVFFNEMELMSAPALPAVPAGAL